MNILSTSAAVLPPNTALPSLPAWKAPSFWAQLLLALTVVLNAVGIDLMGVLGAMGLGGTPDQVIATGERAVSAVQQLLPLIFGVWAWVERRAPHFRLTFRKAAS